MKRGWRLGAHLEKTEFLLVELVAECLDVMSRLSKLAIAYVPNLSTEEHGSIMASLCKKPVILNDPRTDKPVKKYPGNGGAIQG